MNLEKVLQDCELDAQKNSDAELVGKGSVSLGEDECRKILKYVSNAIDYNLKQEKKDGTKERLAEMNKLLCEAGSNMELFSYPHSRSKVSGFRAIAVGCMTTIAEEMDYKLWAENGSKGEDPVYDVPEDLPFVGICAGSEERVAQFRFVKKDASGALTKIPGQGGTDFGRYAWAYLDS